MVFFNRAAATRSFLATRHHIAVGLGLATFLLTFWQLGNVPPVPRATLAADSPWFWAGFTMDSRAVATCRGTADFKYGPLRFWNLRSGQLLAEAGPKGHQIEAVSHFPDGRRFVLYDVTKSALRLFEWASGACLADIPIPT